MPNPTKLTQTNRQVHTDNSGMEIIRSFHCMPYSAHPEVQKILQGTVNDDGTRVPPAHDSYVENAYCTETRVDFADSDAMATAKDIGYNPGNPDILDALQDQKEELAKGVAGAIIHAHYRPLMTAWQADDADAENHRFDWLDVRIVPRLKTLAWPGGLYVTAEGLIDTQRVDVPEEVANPIAISISDVSIRRTLVADPIWDTAATLVNGVNQEFFPNQAHKAADGVPRFQPATLKFVGRNVRYMLDSQGKRWYEITNNFEWIQAFDKIVVDSNGAEREGWVTWQHILIHPRIGSKIGWYEVRKEGVGVGNIQWFGQQVNAGPFHNEVNFLPLFGE